ncbi:hypothetical protein T439DRAFT_350097 [Meredithblackwellia eburnea MCA 4105]
MEGTKKKKPPSCDYCKAKRVLCHPSGIDGIPCPRCHEKGIQCTTTPVIKRKPQKKVTIGSNSPSTSVAVESSIPTFAIPSSFDQLTFSASAPDSSTTSDTVCVPNTSGPSLPLASSFSDSLDLPPSLVEDLLTTFSTLPISHYPLLPSLSNISLEFTPRPLLLSILAVASLYSSHPSLFDGRDPANPIGLDLEIPPPQDLQINLNTNQVETERDYQPFGYARSDFVQSLAAKAKSEAVQEGVATNVCLENAATCHLMDFLDHKLGELAGKNTILSQKFNSSSSTQPPSRTWAAAMVSHLRTLGERGDLPGAGNGGADTRDLRWSAFALTETLSSLVIDAPLLLSDYDLKLICSEDDLVPAATLLKQLRLRKNSVPKTGQPGGLWSCPRPFTLHLVSLCRSTHSSLLSSLARSKPRLNEQGLNAFFSQMTTLRSLLDEIISQGNVAVSLLYRLDSGGELALNDQAQQAFFIRALIFVLTASWASILLPLRRDLLRRVSLPLPFTSDQDEHEDHQRYQERLSLLSHQTRRMTLQAGIRVAKAAKEFAPSVSYLTHVQFLNLEEWAQVLSEERGEDVTREEERWEGLVNIIRSLKLAGWSHINHSSPNLVEMLQLAVLLQRGRPRQVIGAPPTHDLDPTLFKRSMHPELNTVGGADVDIDVLPAESYLQSLEQAFQSSYERDEWMGAF